MRSYLHQPFPAHSLSGSIRMGAFIGLFVALFLLVFQPFGLADMPGGWRKWLAIWGYGAVTFGCIAASAFSLSRLFPGWFRPASWTVSKEIRITLFHFLLIGLANTLYTFLIFRQPFSLRQLFYFELITLAVGALPVSLIVLFRYSRLLAANLKLAQEMNTGLKPLPIISQPLQTPSYPGESSTGTETNTGAAFTFSSETGTDQLTISKADLLFAAAADNYVELHYLKNGNAAKSLIRSSLTRVEEALTSDPRLVRCHRAYLVNLDQVRHFSGNAQGLKLELHHTPDLIPVSRKMVPEIRSLLHG